MPLSLLMFPQDPSANIERTVGKVGRYVVPAWAMHLH